MTPFFYVLELFAEGCEAEFYLNDIPVVRRSDELGKEYKGQCNHRLRGGLNELSAVIQPGATPSLALTGGDPVRRRGALGEARVTAAIARYPYRATMDGPSREELISFAWDSPDSGEPASWPQVHSARVDLGDLWGDFLWSSAEPLRLDVDVRNEVTRFLEQLWDALDRKDWDVFFELSRPRLQGIERAYQLPLGKKEAEHRRIFEADSQRDGFGFVPLDPASYDLRLCGGGRLVEVVDRQGQPVLLENPLGEQGDQSRYDLVLAKLDGAWRVVL